MALYLLAYRLKDDRSYDQRYKSLRVAIESLTQSRWDEGTALHAILYTGTAEQLLDDVRNSSLIYRNGDDLLVAMEVELKDVASVGAERIRTLEFLAKVASGAAGRTLGANGLTEPRAPGGFSKRNGSGLPRVLGLIRK